MRIARGQVLVRVDLRYGASASIMDPNQRVHLDVDVSWWHLVMARVHKSGNKKSEKC